MPLKDSGTFWRSLEIPTIKCKVELKLKLAKYFILPAAGAIISMVMLMIMLMVITLFLLSKIQNYMFLYLLYKKETIENYPNF